MDARLVIVKRQEQQMEPEAVTKKRVTIEQHVAPTWESVVDRELRRTPFPLVTLVETWLRRPENHW